jgi:hypothetical protein
MNKTKQIMLQLDEERYNLVLTALNCIIRDVPRHNIIGSFTEKERVIAEQIKGLVITQWTSSREEEPKYVTRFDKVVSEEEHRTLNLHSFAGDSKKCNWCGRSRKHKLHNS